MIKILYCVPALYNPGGTERVLTEKVNYLVSNCDYEITIITTEQKGKPIYFPLNPKIKLVDLGLNFNDHYDYNLLKKVYAHKRKLHLYKKMLEQYLIEHKTDICISLCGKEIDFLTSLKDSSRKIAELHFSKNSRKQFLLSRKQGKIWEWIGDFRTWQLEHATKKLNSFVVLTQQDFIEWKKTHNNVICIQNPSPLRIKEVSSVMEKRVIAVGRLDEQKGYEYLIEIWSIVSNAHPDWKLDIYGEGALREKLQSKINILNLNDKIFLRGISKDIKQEYLSSSIYIMTSLYEGLPMVLIEAMACGLPLISFDCECGPREVIKDEVNGFLIPPFNVSIYVEKLLLLMDDFQLRKKMSLNSIQFSKIYDIDIIMEKWCKLFN